MNRLDELSLSYKSNYAICEDEKTKEAVCLTNVSRDKISTKDNATWIFEFKAHGFYPSPPSC